MRKNSTEKDTHDSRIHLVQKLMQNIKLMQICIQFELIYKYQRNIINIIAIEASEHD